jgi:hypothetical protein
MALGPVPYIGSSGLVVDATTGLQSLLASMLAGRSECPINVGKRTSMGDAKIKAFGS